MIPECRNSGVTVVIPVYNRSALIGRCLDSIKTQTLWPDHIIIVDNNSTDDSVEAIKRWLEGNDGLKGRFEILSESRPGASAARNRGLMNVTTRFTLFFDSDDAMHPQLIEKAAEAIPGYELVFWKAEVVLLDGKRIEKPYHEDNLLIRHFYNSILSTQQYMAETALFRKAGGWNEDALVWNDWELGIRIALQNPSYTCIPETLVTIYAQGESITGKRFIDRKGEWEKTVELVTKYIEKSGIEDAKKRRLRMMLSYKLASLAAQYSKEGYREEGKALLGEAGQGLPWHLRQLLKSLYKYTTIGGRGAYYIWELAP